VRQTHATKTGDRAEAGMFRRREWAVARFRQTRILQKFAAADASVHNHFNHDRSLERRPRFKDLRDEALAERRQLLAA